MSELIAALVGAVAVLLGERLVVERLRNASTARSLAIAFWEEMSATRFMEVGGYHEFGGFSSQTFDSLFSQLAETIPDGLARDLMRYHWRMKYLDWYLRKLQRYPPGDMVDEAYRLWFALRSRLGYYSELSTWKLFWSRHERREALAKAARLADEDELKRQHERQQLPAQTGQKGE